MVRTSPYLNLDIYPDVRKGLLSRRTYRTFERRAVTAKLRESVLEAARWAPTPEDSHPVRFIVIDNRMLSGTSSG